MSENNRDDELWELLKEPPSENNTKPKSQPRQSGGKFAQPKSQPQKAPKAVKPTSFYVSIVLAVALVVVSALLALQLLDNGQQSDPGIVQNGSQSIQDQTLQKENQELKDQIAKLENTLETLEKTAETSESGSITRQETEKKRLKAHETLVAALNAMLTYDEDTLRQSLNNIEVQKLYEYLSGDTLEAYYMVLEYAEQPYWFAGQE